MKSLKKTLSTGASLCVLLAGCMTETPEKGKTVKTSEGEPIQSATELGILPLPKGGEWLEGYWRGNAIHYYRVDGTNYFDGDIIIPDAEISADPVSSKESSTGRTDGYWPLAEIPFVIDPSANAYTANINAAIEHWRTRTPIQFIPRTTETGYVRFMGSNVNSSNVGRTGSAQNINIVTNSMGVIAHEIGHAIGLWHEQSRSDRETFIEINWANIKTGVRHNFDIESGFSLDNLDYGSIMMYPSFISDPNFTNNPSVWVMRRRSGPDHLERQPHQPLHRRHPGSGRDVSPEPRPSTGPPTTI